jgi:hypothetical protein
MLHELPLVVTQDFWNELIEIDERIARAVAAEGCRRCGGRLHRGDYERKPRGGLIAPVAEGMARRISLCCDREGCRKRALPPSVRFLGRKVYVGAAIVIACVTAQVSASVAEARRSSGIATRTVRRWSRWWRGYYAESEHFEAARSRLMPPVEARELPDALWERFAAHAGDALVGLRRLLGFVAPATTRSVADGSRFVMEV